MSLAHNWKKKCLQFQKWSGIKYNFFFFFFFGCTWSYTLNFVYHIFCKLYWLCGLPCVSDSKECACNAGDLDSILGLGRSPGEGHGNPLQFSCLENPMDTGDWRATVHGVAKSQTRLKLSLWREWLPTPVFLPGESHGQRRLAGYSQWGCKKADTTEQLTLSTSTGKPSIAFSFQDPILLCTLRQITLRSWHPVPSLHGK